MRAYDVGFDSEKYKMNCYREYGLYFGII